MNITNKFEEVVKGKEWTVHIYQKLYPKTWVVDFTILAGFHQSFTLESYERDTKKEARWCAKMLGKALARLEKVCVSGSPKAGATKTSNKSSTKPFFLR